MGIDAIKGVIPGVNFVEWAKAVGRPGWHAALLLIPIIQFFVFAGLCIELVRSFGKMAFWHSFLGVVMPPAMIYLILKDPKSKFEGPYVTNYNNYLAEVKEAKDSGKERAYNKLVSNNPYKKSVGREWVESIIFAVFAAAFIRMFLIEAFVIPTPSMENSLNVGDYLFVSKAHYGIRTPMTVAMFPLLHNRLPIFNKESYLKKPSLPYYRLPSIESIKRNKPIVFNWPIGDSVYITSRRSYAVSQVTRNPYFAASDRELKNKIAKKDYVVRPIDKKDHYIKRCVAMPGDSLQIIDRQIYINGKKGENPSKMQFMYQVSIPPNQNLKRLDDWGIDVKRNIENRQAQEIQGTITGRFFLYQEQVDNLKSMGGEIKVVPIPNKSEGNKLFPHNSKLFSNWTVDDYGPIWIPKKGSTIELNAKNLAMYDRVIGVYEGNDLKIKNGNAIINGTPASQYTFKQDYYWAMGDNRHNSEDSRMWGFVPHDHIVGKPLFIWWSTKYGSFTNGVNWDRIFKSASAM